MPGKPASVLSAKWNPYKPIRALMLPSWGTETSRHAAGAKRKRDCGRGRLVHILDMDRIILADLQRRGAVSRLVH